MVAAISSCGYLRCRIASIIRTIALLVSHQQHLRLTLVADVVVALQPNADMQYQKADFVFADGVRSIFPQLETAARVISQAIG